MRNIILGIYKSKELKPRGNLRRNYCETIQRRRNRSNGNGGTEIYNIA